ncbi:nuclease-related domain-containing DEAD/DEAH box helicase [Chryseobacterium nepalense]|uniref:nuclease-related domain-containing DEAD/DEAH box helicase n=1 Tax=Chryseobacterium nepalense TaxID=1854498 RepID=UPI002DF811F4|nr:hypothetical protein [Chryseobacterium nepalense]
MAKMIPHILFETGSEGEKRIFEALQTKLSNDYMVFHSVRWIGSDRNRSQGEADYLIFHPQKGLIIIEVKAGIIEVDSNRTWYQTNRNTLVKKEIFDPEKQADESKFKFISLLKTYQIMVCHAVWFPSIEFGNQPLPPNYHKDMLFDIKTLDNPEININIAFEYWLKQTNRKTNINQFEQKRIIEKIAPELYLIPSQKIEYDIREQRFNKLTSEQAKVLEFLKFQNTVVINGSAGTGKTVLAIEKARQLAQDGKKVLFLCFNNMLSDYLNSNFGHYGFKISTFDKLCVDTVGFKDTFQKTRLNFLDNILDENIFFEYTDIIIDEGQDFENDWLEYIAEKIDDGCFYVFYDQQQCLYFEDVNKWIKESPCKITLFINCRNTEAIAKTAYGTLGINKKQPILSGIEGEQPELISFENSNDFAIWMDNVVSKYLMETKADKNSVALITMNTLENSIIAETMKNSKFSFSENKEKGFVCISTARKFKGLEADLVIITDLDWNRFNDEVYRKLFYTTCSRAKHNLYINSNKLIDENIDFVLQKLQGDSRRKRRGKKRFLQLLNLKENENIRYQ